MSRYSPEDIRRIFSTSADFNEIFDAFEEAVAMRLEEVEVYRLLFWNNALTSDEVCLFGEKLAREFPHLAYDVFIWLASVFEVTVSSSDNFELAIKYYRKAAEARPNEIQPYLDAADCYNADINIPPIAALIALLRSGLPMVDDVKALLQRLSYLCETAGETDLGLYYRRLADDIDRLAN